MKIGIIGDIHGRDIWKEFVKDETIDKWVFIGDYVDSFDISNIFIYHNLLQILEYKKQNPDKVELLIGNHDWQYIFINGRTNCSGFQSSMANNYQNVFVENRDLFKMAYKYKYHLFTHAGVTTEWFDLAKESLLRYGLEEDLSNIDETLNNLKYTKDKELYDYKGTRSTGEYIPGSPIWCDEKEMLNNPLSGFIHVVGHTNISHKMKVDSECAFFPFKNNVYFTDCLSDHQHFLKLEI